MMTSPSAYFANDASSAAASPFDSFASGESPFDGIASSQAGPALQSIERTACLAWCPTGVTSAAGGNPLMAVATVAGALDASFSTNCQLDVFELTLDHAVSKTPVASVAAPSRFHKLAWTSHASAGDSQGTLIGALEDGTIAIWPAHKLLEGAGNVTPIVKRESSHPVRSLAVNPQTPFLFACGSQEGQVQLYDLKDLSKAFTPGTAPRSQRLDTVTDLAWGPKHAFILAAASSSGSVVLWDLRSRREILSIAAGSSVSSLAWNPEEPTSLAAASDDNSRPVIQTWDLRNANAVDKVLQGGHSKGILSVAWCPQDSELLLSSGKDNKLAFWNPRAGTLLGSRSDCSSNWSYDLQWWPRNPSLFASASFDGHVRVFSYQTLSSGGGPVSADHAATEDSGVVQIPKWLKRPACMAFAFGGRLVSVDNKNRTLHLSSPTDNTKPASTLDEAVKGDAVAAYCQAQAAKQPSFFWSAMAKLTATTDARDAMLAVLGVSKPSAEPASDSAPEDEPQAEALHDDDHINPFSSPSSNEVGAMTDEFATMLAHSPPQPRDDSSPSLRRRSTFSGEAFQLYPSSSSPQDVEITKAIIAGDYKRAVDLCIRAERLSDALLVSVCGGPDLVSRTQRHYVRTMNLPYLRVVSGIVKGDLKDVIDNADVRDWRDLLALACAKAANHDDFVRLSLALGDRISVELADDVEAMQGAILAFVLGGDSRKASALILKSAKRAVAKGSTIDSSWIVALVDRIRLVHMYSKREHELGQLVQQDVPELLRWFLLYAFVLEERGNAAGAGRLLSSLNVGEAASLPLPLAAFLARLGRNTECDLKGLAGHSAFTTVTVVAEKAPEAKAYSGYGQPAYSQPYSQPAYSAQYNQPTAQYSQPAPQYSQPSTQYSQPSSQYTQPASQYAQPAAQYAQPGSQPAAYSPPAQTSRYAAPSASQYAAPATSQYTASTSQYATASQYAPSAASQYAQPAVPASTSPYTGIMSSAPLAKPVVPMPSISQSSGSAVPTPSVVTPLTGPPSQAPVMAAFNDAPIVAARAPRAAPPVIASPVPASAVPAGPLPPTLPAASPSGGTMTSPSAVAAPQGSTSQQVPPGMQALLMMASSLDPTKIPAHLQPVYQSLNRLIGLCMQRSSPTQRRIVDDSVRRLQTLIGQLCNNQLSQSTQQQLLTLAQLLQRQSWDDAAAACQTLMSTAFSECGQWIVACKRLVDLGRTLSAQQ